MANSHTSFFFSDIVGYSKMVEHDESMAHRMLKEPFPLTKLRANSLRNQFYRTSEIAVGEVAFQLIRFP